MLIIGLFRNSLSFIVSWHIEEVTDALHSVILDFNNFTIFVSNLLSLQEKKRNKLKSPISWVMANFDCQLETLRGQVAHASNPNH